MSSLLKAAGLVMLGVWAVEYGAAAGRHGRYPGAQTVRLFGWCFVAAGVCLLLYTLVKRLNHWSDPLRTVSSPIGEPFTGDPHRRTSLQVVEDAPLPLRATYYERRADGERAFEIADRRLQITEKGLLAESSRTVDLSTVSPVYSVSRARNVLFSASVVLLVVASALAARSLPAAGGVIGAAMLMMAVSFRKQTVYRFKHLNGSYAFEVWGAGPQRTRAEDFVKSVASAIEAIAQSKG